MGGAGGKKGVKVFGAPPVNNNNKINIYLFIDEHLSGIVITSVNSNFHHRGQWSHRGVELEGLSILSLTIKNRLTRSVQKHIKSS